MSNIIGQAIHNLLKKEINSCQYIDSDSKDQTLVASKWNSNSLKVLITTTLGLVGNESSNTQMVCIVGLLYNLPLIVQAYGRIRPSRRKEYSICSIFTLKKNNRRLWQDSSEHSSSIEAESSNAFNELVGNGLMSLDNKEKYDRSMTMMAVNDWLFKDQGCRLVSLAGRLGYRHKKCNICDNCTNTNVNTSAGLKQKAIRNNNIRRNEGIRILKLLKNKCLCCNSSTCDGSCVVRKMKGIVCFQCLGPHVARNCPKEYRNILSGKACYSCWAYNYSDSVVHDHTVCSVDGGIKERLRAIIQSDYIEQKTKKGNASSFNVHLAGIFAGEETFFRFLYKYHDWK